MGKTVEKRAREAQSAEARAEKRAAEEADTALSAVHVALGALRAFDDSIKTHIVEVCEACAYLYGDGAGWKAAEDAAPFAQKGGGGAASWHDAQGFAHLTYASARQYASVGANARMGKALQEGLPIDRAIGVAQRYKGNAVPERTITSVREAARKDWREALNAIVPPARNNTATLASKPENGAPVVKATVDSIARALTVAPKVQGVVYAVAKAAINLLTPVALNQSTSPHVDAWAALLLIQETLVVEMDDERIALATSKAAEVAKTINADASETLTKMKKAA